MVVVIIIFIQSLAKCKLVGIGCEILAQELHWPINNEISINLEVWNHLQQNSPTVLSKGANYGLCMFI